MDENKTSQEKNRNPYKQILTLGLVITLGAGYFFTKNVVIAMTYNKTVAKVLSVKEQRSSGTKSSSTYIPTLRYSTENGGSISSQPLIGSSMYNFDRGEKLTVYYNPKQPHEFHISTFLTMWFLQGGGLLLGLLIIKTALSFKNGKENA